MCVCACACVCVCVCVCGVRTCVYECVCVVFARVRLCVERSGVMRVHMCLIMLFVHAKRPAVAPECKSS